MPFAYDNNDEIIIIKRPKKTTRQVVGCNTYNNKT